MANLLETCDERSDANASESPASLLKRRHVAAFGLVAGLLVVNQLVVQPALIRMALDAPTINVAGRQRMLSQRLAKASLAASRSVAGRAYSLGELALVRDEWSTSQERLRDEAEARGDATIREAFRRLDPTFRRMLAASLRLSEAYQPASPDEASASRALESILNDEPSYLNQMDRIVSLFEARARSRVDRLLWTGRAATALALLGLVGIGRLVLLPATRLINRQVDALRQARSDLEARVRERTASLEAANVRLQHESEERSRAEARHRALLEMVSHASRTQTLGEMASGLAHELNQPLGAITTYAEGCLVALGDDRPEVAAAVARIRSSALRAGEVIKRIRRFVTRHEPEHEAFDPNQAVAEVAALLADDARARQITLRTDLAPGLPYLVGDPVQIQQVLINLARNAMEAVDATQRVEREVLLATRAEAESLVELAVTDTGEGISAEALPRIFDTYYSTRADGMGMGLAISRTIVEAHEGTLTAESTPGVATTFRVRLPRDRARDDPGADGHHR